MTPAWIMVGIAVAGIILQAGVGLTMLRVLYREVNNLRRYNHEHANLLTEHEARLDEHERRLKEGEMRFEDHEHRIVTTEREVDVLKATRPHHK